jgi:hypothetical protein
VKHHIWHIFQLGCDEGLEGLPLQAAWQLAGKFLQLLLLLLVRRLLLLLLELPLRLELPLLQLPNGLCKLPEQLTIYLAGHP